MTTALRKRRRQVAVLSRKQSYRKKNGGPEVPGDDWSLHKLGARAVVEHGRIDQADKLVTPAYWYLGRALNAARKHFKRGSWQRWLAEHKIGEDCGLRARLIGKAFDRPVDVTGLSLRKALAIAKGHGHDLSDARLLRNLELRLKGAAKAALDLAQEIDMGRHRSALVAVIENALDALGGVRHRCEAHAEFSSREEIA